MHTEPLSRLEVSGRKKKSFSVKYKHCIRCSFKELLKQNEEPINSEETQKRMPGEEVV